MRIGHRLASVWINRLGIMAAGGAVNEIVTNEDADLDEFRINYTKLLGRFECPWEKWKTPSTKALLTWKYFEKDSSNIPTKEKLDVTLPILPMELERIENPPDDNIQVTWIGHATLLVQIEGVTILTDPVFGKYCGPKVPIPGINLGYKRYRNAAFEVKDIPHIDAVIVSHDHYDHLDSESVTEIKNKFPDVKWFVAKNSRDLCQVKKMNESNVTDLLWWQEKRIELKGKIFRFVCTPAQHWCRRGATDMNKRLWCSWIIKGPTKSFFFAGDTGYYQPVFKKIGEKYGPFTLAALPIGCFEPRSILKYQHINPDEAAKVHYDIRSEYSVSMHWGTFKTMAVEFYLDPPRLLETEMGDNKDSFISLQHGETWTVGEERQRPSFLNNPVRITETSNTESNNGTKEPNMTGESSADNANNSI